MRILCDLDSIIVNLQEAWLGAYNRDYNDNVQTADILEWDTHKFVKPECGEKLYEYLNQPGFFRNLKPLDGAVDALRELHKDFKITIVTAAPVGTADEKVAWVGEWLPFLDNKKDVIVCFNKYLVRGDILIDDSPRNILDYRKYHFYSTICTIAYPYNKIVKELTDLYAEDYSKPREAWNQIYSYIQGLQ